MERPVERPCARGRPGARASNPEDALPSRRAACLNARKSIVEASVELFTKGPIWLQSAKLVKNVTRAKAVAEIEIFEGNMEAHRSDELDELESEDDEEDDE